MAFSSSQPSLSPRAQMLLNWICFSQKWWLLSHLATAEGDSGAFWIKDWQSHPDSFDQVIVVPVGDMEAQKWFDAVFCLFQGHRNPVPMSVWVCEVSFCIWVLLLGFLWKDKEKQDFSSWPWTWNKLFLIHLVQIFGCEQSLGEIKPTNLYFFNVREYQSKSLCLPYLNIKQ